MKISCPTLCMLALSALHSILATAQVPVIHGVIPIANSVELNGKFEALLDMTAVYTNPYDYDEIRVNAVFTAPNGTQTTVEGFYMEDYQIANQNTGSLSPLGVNSFRIRFSPRQIGVWTYSVSCTNSSGTGTFSAQTFQCVSSGSGLNKGFVQSDQSNYLHFENGEQYIPVGENIAWQNINPYVDYKTWVAKLADNGGNFLRLWMCHWGMGIEWKQDVAGFPGLKKYKQVSAYYIDWLLDYCAEKGVYVMFCLNHHGQVSSQVNPNWSENPYNMVNGGPCQNTWDFFTNTQAKSLMKNRLRYTLARWGYQRSVMTWELFNEINWTDNYEQHKPEIAAWHAEMAAFLKQGDYTSRPVSTSYGTPGSEDPAVWNNPDMDYSQRHYYVDNPNLEAILAAGIKENLALYDKPAHIGEFGLSAGGGDLVNLDPNGIHIHNNLWGTLFGGAIGSGMTWWWDSYIEPQNLYHHFNGISSVAAKSKLHEKDFRPVVATVQDAPGDLTLNPSLGWGELGDGNIQISNSGNITPANYKLCQFLYGATWNTQFRSPPTFSVNMPQAGQFKVLAGAQFGASPKLVILLDGVQALSVTPAANQVYTINVPSGQHSVKVDNSGTDWMTIASYTFSGLGSSLSAYVLRSADNSGLAGWVLNKNYNHVFVKSNGAPNPVNNAKISVQNIANGTYQAKWFNCQTGALAQVQPVTVSANALTLPIPELLWDMAFILEDQSVGTQELSEAMSMTVYPNPVSEASFQVAFHLESTQRVELMLYNTAGAMLQKLFSGTLQAGDQTVNAQISGDLPLGLYWVQMTAGHQKTARAIEVLHP